MGKFAHIDTTRPAGTYIEWERIELVDEHAEPDWLFQDPDYRDEDQARLDAFHAGDWHLIGIIARAHIMVVSAGVGTMYTMDSAGLWEIESDSGEDFLNEVFEEEKAAILHDMRRMGETLAAPDAA